ncbi:MAG TPA: hypothetical protein VH478_24940 [Trebonia sp.]|nr:hypothetical protein [Trebonia sp.]
MPDLDEDVLRHLMVRATADLAAPPAAASRAIRRERRHRVQTRVTAVAGTAAAAGVAAGVLVATAGSSHPVSGTGPVAAGGSTIQLTAAQRTLFGLSAAAAATPRPAGRYVVMTEQTTSNGDSASEAGGETTVIDTLTGGGVTYQDISLAHAGGTPAPPGTLTFPKGTSPTSAQLDATTTVPAALRQLLLKQAEGQIAQAEQMELQKWQLEEKELGKTLPKPKQPQETDDNLVFSQATTWLWTPNLSPQLRSALYKALAAIPGVTVKTGAADSSGRPATEISRHDTTSGATVETFEDPATGVTLETSDVGPGSALSEDLYKKISYTSTLPGDPYKK